MRPPQAESALGERIEALFRTLPGAGAPADLQALGAGWVSGRAGPAGHGTKAAFHLRLDPAHEVVTDARFQALGCPHTLAVAAWLAQGAVGQRLDALPPVGGVRRWAEELGVPIERLGRLLVLEEALRAALAAARPGDGAAGEERAP